MALGRSDLHSCRIPLLIDVVSQRRERAACSVVEHAPFPHPSKVGSHVRLRTTVNTVFIAGRTIAGACSTLINHLASTSHGCCGGESPESTPAQPTPATSRTLQAERTRYVRPRWVRVHSTCIAEFARWWNWMNAP